MSLSTICLAFIALTFTSCQSIQQLNVTGLVAAVFSPFTVNGTLNVTKVPEQAKFLSDTGVSYVFIAGTTGESVSLSQNEREKLLEAWITIAPTYNLHVIAHVGANCMEESRALTKHALSLNSPHLVAFAAMATSFFKPATIEALTMLMKAVAEGAPNLPFYYYHIPSMTGVEFGMYDFMTFAGEHIPNLAGIKYTGLYDSESSFPDLLRLMAYKSNTGRTYEILTGRDEMLIQCLVSGVKGFVGSQYNFAGELYNNIIMEYNKGNIDNARELTLQADLLLTDVSQNMTAGRNGVKYMMVEAGVDVGDSRLPFLKLNQEEKTMEEQNTLKWCDQTNDALSWCKNLRQRLMK